MIVGKRFHFDAAHFLPAHEGKCHNWHGHSYTLDVEVEGNVQENGMVMDLFELKKMVEEIIINFYDHKDLNHYITNPTCENIIDVFKLKLTDFLPVGVKLYSLILQEGFGGWAKWIRK